MKKISDLDFGFIDAENYRRRENKAFLNKVFFDDDVVSKIFSNHVSFVIGEKGTGKTTYATYISNNGLNNTCSHSLFIRETEFRAFMSLKQEKHLILSDYVVIWKVILLLVLAGMVCEKEGSNLYRHFTKIKQLKSVIDEYYNNAFSPEITQAMEFVRNSQVSAEMVSSALSAEKIDKNKAKINAQRFQTNLFSIKKHFEDVFLQMRPDNDYILFLDGIDIRPNKIDYEEYLDCIKGLATAVWELNNDFFPSIKGKKGRFHCILLVRPDIFANFGLQNQNSKLENSILLDWKTDYKGYASSNLYKMMNKLLSSQQEDSLEQSDTKIWEKYFPWTANYYDDDIEQTSFVDFLRISYYRPRDIIKMISLMKDLTLKHNKNAIIFCQSTFNSDEFKRMYSDYLLGEIKDHLMFYYSEKDYDCFVNFFVYLNGKASFSYNDFCAAYNNFKSENGSGLPVFMDTANSFLQFLYDLNVLCYKETVEEESKPFVRWCFRERSYANVSPKIRLYEEYGIFPGLQKSLNLGKSIKHK